ncbi:Type IV prepilin peptidase TadV/CpaA [Rhodovastum atsumiense]|nr:Type IV prepilin peptidase TadV/CpaA [Rhodovastum atsumiense]
MNVQETFFLGVTCTSVGLLLAAALHDTATRTIPNWIPAALAIAGLLLRAQDGNLAMNLGIAVLLLALFGCLWLRGYVGGGDMKLIPAAALALPPHDIPTFLLSMALAGGVVALVYLALSAVVRRPPPGRRHGLPSRLLKAEAWRIYQRGAIPYGVAIAAGSLPLLVHTLSG